MAKSISKKSKQDNPWFAFIRKIQKEQGIKKWGDAIKAAVKEKPRYFKEKKSGEQKGGEQKGGENDDAIGDSDNDNEMSVEEQSGGKRRRKRRTAKKSKKSKKSKSRRTRRRH